MAEEDNIQYKGSTSIHTDVQSKENTSNSDMNDPLKFDEIAIKLQNDVSLLNNKVWGEQYTNEELLKRSNECDVEMLLAKREIIRRFRKTLNNQRSLNAEYQKLKYNYIEANKKLHTVEDKLKNFKIEKEDIALRTNIKIRNMEKDVESSAAKVKEMAKKVYISATKTRRLEEDAQGNALKLRKMEENASLSAKKIRKMELEAELAAIEIKKMQEEVNLKDAKISKMENDSKIVEQQHIKQMKEASTESAKKALFLYKRSKVFVGQFLEFLNPIYSAGWTDCLQEIQRKHLPNLNVKEFQRFDIDAWKKVNEAYNSFCSSTIELENLLQTSECLGICPENSGASTSHS